MSLENRPGDILSKMERTAKSAWKETEDKELGRRERIASGANILDEALTVLKEDPLFGDMAEKAFNDSAGFLVKFGDIVSLSYSYGFNVEFLTLTLGVEQLMVELKHKKATLSNAHIAISNTRDGSVVNDTLAVCQKGHGMVDKFSSFIDSLHS